MNIPLLIRRHPLFSYFSLAYAVSWGGILFIAALRGFNPAAIGLMEGALMYLFMILGPSLTGILLTALLDGKDGVRKLFGRMGRWRTGWRGYILISIVPLLAVPILFLLSALVSPAYAPNQNLVFGLVLGGLAGFFEETGWTGFALPRLQTRNSVFASGLILGLLWSGWHGMADYWGNFASFGSYWLPFFILYWILPLTAYRILMAWVYSRTGSLLIAQVMHLFYTGSLITLQPALPVTESMVWVVPFAAALWLVVLAVFWFQKRARTG